MQDPGSLPAKKKRAHQNTEQFVLAINILLALDGKGPKNCIKYLSFHIDS
jgi:hypothetical protein